MTTMIIVRLVFGLIIVSVVLTLIAIQYNKTGKPFPWKWFVSVLAVFLVVLFFWNGGCGGKKTQPAAMIVEEGLVLKYKGVTPCSSFVGWNYIVRTDGDAIDIKYNGCDWFAQPAKGSFNAPSGFKPGEALFKSPNANNPHFEVRVYKKITVQSEQ